MLWKPTFGLIQFVNFKHFLKRKNINNALSFPLFECAFIFLWLDAYKQFSIFFYILFLYFSLSCFSILSDRLTLWQINKSLKQTKPQKWWARVKLWEKCRVWWTITVAKNLTLISTQREHRPHKGLCFR